MRQNADSRAVSPVVGVVLLVAVTTLAAATVGAFALGIDQRPPTPTVVTTAEPLEAYDASDGDREQRVRLVHEAGPPVDVEDLTIVVSVDGGERQTRVVDLPVGHNRLTAPHVEGEDFLDRSHGETVGSLSTAPPDSDRRWDAGDQLGLRLVSGDVRLAPGDRVVVTVLHEPSGGVVAEETVVAR